MMMKMKVMVKWHEDMWKEIKNIEPKGITNPGIPFAITASPENM